MEFSDSQHQPKSHDYEYYYDISFDSYICVNLYISHAYIYNKIKNYDIEQNGWNIQGLANLNKTKKIYLFTLMTSEHHLGTDECLK